MAGVSGVPALRSSSPLADGLTVNLSTVGHFYRLRIWVMGAPVENSTHETPTEALVALGRIVAERMGGEVGILGAFLKHAGRKT